ncbi:MAG: PhoU domain-containing protein [Pirellulaceae bacterium]
MQEHCVSVLENARPIGSELRFVIAVLKINDSLERIGDLAENVAAIIADVGDWERFTKVGGLNELAEMAQHMVNQSLSALIHRDTDLAHEVIRKDG